MKFTRKCLKQVQEILKDEICAKYGVRNLKLDDDIDVCVMSIEGDGDDDEIRGWFVPCCDTLRQAVQGEKINVNSIDFKFTMKRIKQELNKRYGSEVEFLEEISKEEFKRRYGMR